MIVGQLQPRQLSVLDSILQTVASRQNSLQKQKLSFAGVTWTNSTIAVKDWADHQP